MSKLYEKILYVILCCILYGHTAFADKIYNESEQKLNKTIYLCSNSPKLTAEKLQKFADSSRNVKDIKIRQLDKKVDNKGMYAVFLSKDGFLASKRELDCLNFLPVPLKEAKKQVKEVTDIVGGGESVCQILKSGPLPWNGLCSKQKFRGKGLVGDLVCL
ncbi:hypothetical protein [Flexibacterium corallicola]|uniref:hypothetical protein n=1 Tax=Flexibacterium corallicola TaxID=3037259 RepID=UPI00286F1F7B|nr:hypothetical protein [Pseudovibrio sp. M1P-2-3]